MLHSSFANISAMENWLNGTENFGWCGLVFIKILMEAKSTFTFHRPLLLA